MKLIIILLLAFLPAMASANSQIPALDCLDAEYDLAKKDYPFSGLSRVLDFESFLKLRCQSEINFAVEAVKNSESFNLPRQADEVLDPNCPNCLRFRIEWNPSGLSRVGIKRNNIFLVTY